jgi:hypothetical protein
MENIIARAHNQPLDNPDEPTVTKATRYKKHTDEKKTIKIGVQRIGTIPATEG